MCRFEGEDEDVKNERSFNAQKVWKRIIVVIAGPLTNLVFAIVLLVYYADDFRRLYAHNL